MAFWPYDAIFHFRPEELESRLSFDANQIFLTYLDARLKVNFLEGHNLDCVANRKA